MPAPRRCRIAPQASRRLTSRTQTLKKQPAGVRREPLESCPLDRKPQHPPGDRERDEGKDAQADRRHGGEPRVSVAAQAAGSLLALQDLHQERSHAPGEMLDELSAKATAFREHFLHDKRWQPGLLASRRMYRRIRAAMSASLTEACSLI